MASEVRSPSPGGSHRQWQSVVGSSKTSSLLRSAHMLWSADPCLWILLKMWAGIYMLSLLTPPCPQSVTDTCASHDCIFMPWFLWNVVCRQKATSQPQLRVMKEKQTFGYLSHRNTHTRQWLCRSWEQSLPTCRSLHSRAILALNWSETTVCILSIIF